MRTTPAGSRGAGRSEPRVLKILPGVTGYKRYALKPPTGVFAKGVFFVPMKSRFCAADTVESVTNVLITYKVSRGFPRKPAAILAVVSHSLKLIRWLTRAPS